MIFYEAHKLSGFQAFWHLCYYFPNEKTEFYSNKVIGFKRGGQSEIEFWENWVAYDFLHSIFKTISFELVIRVLGHDELEAKDKRPLDVIGSRIAAVRDSVYKPDIIGKLRVNKKLSFINSKVERESELKDNYYMVDKSYKEFGGNVLIIDDIKTSGTSMLAIRELLTNEGFKGKVYGFSLAVTEKFDQGKNDDIEIPEK
ncbi:hypothetical protein [uncultured Cyclobacterium sp.]|uniref:hypothetical protein n=1 Tax=uncultured Cyclobacterium sp. TaxID=453820 RepID=UPI0030ED1B99|tara:strand:- start:1368 stop:1967 length:600 start_codon:yes stop_codon:yes gene_type:complete